MPHNEPLNMEVLDRVKPSITYCLLSKLRSFQEVLEDEIKETLFSLFDNKAPVRGVHHTANGNTSHPGNTSSPKIDLKFIKPRNGGENGRVKVQPPQGVAAAGSGNGKML
ncbi:unnamed protein product [Ilex paraguariensis]|uniref:Uncharacterized protein n=1 Tax=Ilex paraguariensis TaxID=185542 RepID=A0ABC8URH8_9AQUA